jgi:competence protein ComEC
MGILVIVLALCNSLPDFLAIWYNGLIGFMNSVIQWVAKQEAFIFRNITFDTMQLVLSYLIIMSGILVFTKTTFKRVNFILLSIIGFQLWILYSTYTTEAKENLFVAHKIKNTLILHQAGSDLDVITKNKIATGRIVTDYQVAERIKNINYKIFRNSYNFKDKTILVIDSLGVYNPQKSDYIILTQSPKINLERLIDATKPQQIIVDGSNYHSDVNRWKQTCSKRKLPFHYTGEKGVFYFE